MSSCFTIVWQDQSTFQTAGKDAGAHLYKALQVMLSFTDKTSATWLNPAGYVVGSWLLQTLLQNDIQSN